MSKLVSQQWDVFRYSSISSRSEGQMKMSAAHPQVPQNVQRETAGKGESVQDRGKYECNTPQLK